MEIITATKRFRRFMFGSGSDWLRLTLVPLTQVGFKSDGGENGGRIQGELAAELRLDYGGRTTKRGLAAQLPMVKSADPWMLDSDNQRRHRVVHSKSFTPDCQCFEHIDSFENSL
ncbi:MAG: hypothetical protein ABSD58_01395 [Verrucomicrobiia bacterium]